MGTDGYKRAADIEYRDGEVILEIGSGESTYFLAGVDPDVHTVDPVPLPAWTMPDHVFVYTGYAENVRLLETLQIGFAWLDGWDFPYDGVDYTAQRAQYEARGQTYSQEASRQSHLAICQRIAARTRVIAFDDTWRTHQWVSDRGGTRCGVPVPPATYPAPALAMDHPLPGFILGCWLEPDHPHHNSPERGWDGKGGEAVPWLLENGFRVVEYGLGLVVVERER